jgi:hypothetical protein
MQPPITIPNSVIDSLEEPIAEIQAIIDRHEAGMKLLSEIREAIPTPSACSDAKRIATELFAAHSDPNVHVQFARQAGGAVVWVEWLLARSSPAVREAFEAGFVGSADHA